MKIKRLSFLLLSVSILLSSCGFWNNSSNTGLVILSLTSSSRNSRALNSEGLPQINTASITLEISDTVSGKKNKRKLSPKSPSASVELKVGKTFLIKAILNNDIGVWIGEKNLQVEKGTTHVKIAINKRAREFRPIGFSVTQTGSNFKYTLDTESNIKIENSAKFIIETTAGKPKNEPIFCINNKGGIYTIGGTGSNYTIYYYNSEGVYSKELDLTNTVNDLTYDYKTGKAYILENNQLGTIVENFSGLATEGPKKDIELKNPSGKRPLIAIFDNTIALMEVEKSNSIGIFKTNGTTITTIKENNFGASGIYDNAIYSDISTKINDIFANEDNLYILFSVNGNPLYSPHLGNLQNEVSIGGILKIEYKIDLSKDEAIFSNPQFFGLGDFTEEPPNKIPTDEYYAEHFYKPIKFVGFDGESLYIADDGKKYEWDSSTAKFKANVDRIAKFNLENESLSFEATTSTWLTNE